MTPSPRYRINEPHVVHEVFDDGEAAIINLRTGTYYSLDAVGAGIWALLDRGNTLGEIVGAIAGRYAGDPALIADTVRRFVTELHDEQLIVEAAAGAGGRPVPDAPAPRAIAEPRLPFAPPQLERFNDMNELLLLDPIHEVDEAGWPARPPEEPR